MALLIVSHGKPSYGNFPNLGENAAFKDYYHNRVEIFGIVQSIAEFLSLLLLAQGIEPNPGPFDIGTELTKRYSPERGYGLESDDNTYSDWDDDTSCSSIHNNNIDNNFMNKFSKPVPLDDKVVSQYDEDFEYESDWDSDTDDSDGSLDDQINHKSKTEYISPKVSYYDVKDYADTDDDMDCYSDLEYDDNAMTHNKKKLNICNSIVLSEVNTEQCIANDQVTTDSKIVEVKDESKDDDSIPSDNNEVIHEHNDVNTTGCQSENDAMKSRSLSDVEAIYESDWDSESETSVMCSSSMIVENVIANGEKENDCMRVSQMVTFAPQDSVKQFDPNSHSLCDTSWSHTSDDYAHMSNTDSIEDVPSLPLDECISTCDSSNISWSHTSDDYALMSNTDSIEDVPSLPLDECISTCDSSNISWSYTSDDFAHMSNTKSIENVPSLPVDKCISTCESSNISWSHTSDDYAQMSNTDSIEDVPSLPLDECISTCDSSNISWSHTSDDYAHMSNTDSIEDVPSLPLDHCISANISNDSAIMSDISCIENISSLPFDECANEATKDLPLTVVASPSCVPPASDMESEELVTCEEVFDWSAYMNKRNSQLPKDVQQAKQEKSLVDCIASKSDTSTDSVNECLSYGDNTLDDISDSILDGSDNIPLKLSLDVDAARNNSTCMTLVNKNDLSKTEAFLTKIVTLPRTVDEEENENKLRRCAQIRETNAKYILSNNIRPQVHNSSDDIKPEFLSRIDNKKCNGKNDTISIKSDTGNTFKGMEKNTKASKSRLSKILHRMMK